MIVFSFSFVLQICDALSGVKRKSYSQPGSYFFRIAIESQARRRLNFPAHQEAMLKGDEPCTLDDIHYDNEFWSSSLVRAWIIVHVVQEWYQYDLSKWATEEARKIVKHI